MVTSNFKKLNKTKNSKDKYDIAEFSKLQSIKKKKKHDITVATSVF